jgi:hypothetical protein
MDYKTVFKDKEGQSIFLKTTAGPAVGSAEKATLNRKGNISFNMGDIESARRIFLTTGYSDGLSRCGDYYQSRGRAIDALKMYWLAHDRNKAEQIIMGLSVVIRRSINEEQKQ